MTPGNCLISLAVMVAMIYAVGIGLVCMGAV
jgi:hypothetical protein